MEVHVRQASVQRFLLDAISVVALAGLSVEIAQDGLGMDDPYDLVDLLSLSYERNIPTWLSAGMHATSAVLLTLIANGSEQQGGPFLKHWRGLSFIFAYISIDEFVTIHENMNSWLDLGGIFYFSWVIPASVMVTIFVLSYLKFLFHLPAITRFRFVRAGAIFVGGAMGVELVLSYWTDLYGSSNLGYARIDWVEETMEMCGAALFLSANVAVLADQTGHIRILSGADETDTAANPASDDASAPSPDDNADEPDASAQDGQA